MKRRPIKGDIIRHLPSWVMREMQGGRVFQPAVAAQLSYAEVYNDSQAGSYLYIWGVIAAAPTNEIVLETQQGKLQTAAGISGPLWAGESKRAGVLGRYTSAICTGIEIGTIETVGNSQAWWPYNWPCAVIPPGYAFTVHTSNVNSNLSVGIWWHASQEI